MVLINTKADKVTFQRAEIKYQLFEDDLSFVRKILRSNCLQIKHDELVSNNNTLYFEDPHFSSYHENKGGISRRWKSRIRWYNSEVENVFFEFKERSGIFSSKNRVKLSLPEPIGNICYRDLKKIISSQLSNEQREKFLYRSEPVLINRYKREYFSDPHSNIRLTMDYDLSCYNQLHHTKPTFRFAHKFPGLIILECKVEKGSTEKIARLLSPLKLRICQSSKYVLCLEELNQY